ncbi:hypothetical protein LzC2_42620 [Planctomycetes bacterium LzC2]|uniref:Uncharacterized protein n=1 Tax=Alienimonas chondri TaxID=2681879 RepID=A0ABX1VJ77_9PLAN|nr:hypothetical protein [Alienimonas chondri]
MHDPAGVGELQRRTDLPHDLQCLGRLHRFAVAVRRRAVIGTRAA